VLNLAVQLSKHYDLKGNIQLPTFLLIMYFDYFVSNVIMLYLMVVLLVSNKLEMV